MPTSNKRTTKRVTRKAARPKIKKPMYKNNRPEHVTKEYQVLVRLVRERDGNACAYPGCKKRRWNLECHHILPWSQFPKLRYEPGNCIMLCKKCHKKVSGHELLYAGMFFQIVQANIAKQEKKLRGYYYG
jgi:5-methylcytosine-specific restriction endonuclease McrA